MDNILIYILQAFFFLYIIIRLKNEMHYVQLNSYMNDRYFRWLRKNYFETLRITEIGLLALTLLSLLGLSIVFDALFALFLIVSIYRISKQKQKKKFVFTARAIRLYSSAAIVLMILFVSIIYFFNQPINYTLIFLILLDLLLFAVIMVSNIIIRPVESMINRWYYNDAKKKLKQMPNLLIIGITGSYGKTSTKFFLNKLLSEKYNVLMTPESYNTPMGVIKTIRTSLKPIHQVFIVEMGAKQIGDIKEICDLVNPKIGIITAIAEQHLETFKNIQNVQKTKFELANALPTDGKAFLNADYATIKSYTITNPVAKCYYSTEDKNLDYNAQNIVYTRLGTRFDIFRQQQKLCSVETKLLGKYNISNILACCAVADELGVEPNNIIFAVKGLQPVSHRLEIRTNSNGITIIDDAFNSNPYGASMALDVLSLVEGKKKIIVTPGMIELANKESFYNNEFGKQIANVCDYVILVGEKQTGPIYDGLIESKYDTKNIYVARDLNDATNNLKNIVSFGDVILYENDLPDTYKK